MTAALRLVLTTMPPTVSPVRDYRPSTRPTLVPESRPTTPTSGTTIRVQEDVSPPTQRSATIPTRAEAAARQEAYNLLAVMRMNADFLQSLIEGGGSPVAREALEDLHRGIDRLERRFALSKTVLPR